MNPESFNMSIRKFLKSVGVQSQREMRPRWRRPSPRAASRAARPCPPR